MPLLNLVCLICGSLSSYTSFLYLIFFKCGYGSGYIVFPLFLILIIGVGGGGRAGRVGFVWLNFVGDFVSYCFPSCYVMYTCISSANKIIYANKTIDIMKVIEMFTFFRSF